KTNQSIIGKGIIGFSTKPFETCLKIAAIFNIFLITIIGLVLGYTFLWYYTRFPDFSYQTNKIISALLYGIIAFFIGWILTSFAYGLIFSFLSLKKTCENINKQFDNIAKMLNKK
ncbi:MAG: hypothetical protein J6W76_00735, partial [Spirochaetales bacterium]|nr:hypothetical protein [Spirochaetales bacterium]